MTRFLDALHAGRVLLMDGAMGTELRRAGLPDGGCGEQWNLTRPECVLAVHQAYRAVGAECLLTNTFQANPPALARHGLHEQLELIHHAALTLAREASAPDGFVLLDLGPWVPEPESEILDRLLPLWQQADALLVETCTDPRLLERVTAAWRAFAAPLLLFSLTYLRDADGTLRTPDGMRPEELACRTRDYPVVALGVNCGRDLGMDEILEILRRYRTVSDLPLFARPNAGTPARVDGRWVHPLTPEKMAERLPALLEAGITLVGGCCGTTPAHIAACRPVVDEWNRQHAPSGTRS